MKVLLIVILVMFALRAIANVVHICIGKHEMTFEPGYQSIGLIVNMAFVGALIYAVMNWL